MNLFEIERKEAEGYGLVTLTGEIDLSTAPDLERELKEALGSLPSPLVIDMSGVAFIDSSGLRVLLAVKREAEEGDRRIAVVPSVRVRRVLDLTGIAAEIELLEDRSQIGT